MLIVVIALITITETHVDGSTCDSYMVAALSDYPPYYVPVRYFKNKQEAEAYYNQRVVRVEYKGLPEEAEW